MEHRRGRVFKTSNSGRNRIDATPVPVRKSNVRTGISIEQRTKPVMGEGPAEVAESVDPGGVRICMIHPEGRLV